MANVSLKGNIGSAPELKTVNVNGEDKQLVEFRMKSTEGYTDKNTNEWVDQGAWYSVAVWGDTMRDAVMKNLSKGNPVYVVGQQTTDNWKDEKSGEDRQNMQIRAQAVMPWLPGIESIKFEERRSPSTASAAAAEAAMA